MQMKSHCFTIFVPLIRSTLWLILQFYLTTPSVCDGADCYCEPCNFPALTNPSRSCSLKKNSKLCSQSDKKICSSLTSGCAFMELTNKNSWTPKCRCIQGWAGVYCDMPIEKPPSPNIPSFSPLYPSQSSPRLSVSYSPSTSYLDPRHPSFSLYPSFSPLYSSQSVSYSPSTSPLNLLSPSFSLYPFFSHLYLSRSPSLFYHSQYPSELESSSTFQPFFPSPTPSLSLSLYRSHLTKPYFNIITTVGLSNENSQRMISPQPFSHKQFPTKYVDSIASSFTQQTQQVIDASPPSDRITYTETVRNLSSLELSGAPASTHLMDIQQTSQIEPMSTVYSSFSSYLSTATTSMDIQRKSLSIITTTTTTTTTVKRNLTEISFLDELKLTKSLASTVFTNSSVMRSTLVGINPIKASSLTNLSETMKDGRLSTLSSKLELMETLTSSVFTNSSDIIRSSLVNVDHKGTLVTSRLVIPNTAQLCTSYHHDDSDGITVISSYFTNIIDHMKGKLN